MQKGYDDMKKERQDAIIKIVTSENIETQNQLIDALAMRGIESTQATLSRDIKALQLVKELTANGVYRYTINEHRGTVDHGDRLKAIFKESVTSFATAQNMVVVKTLPGLAPAACSAIDSMGIENLVGTIAGDDTGFLAMSDVVSAENFCKEIVKMLR